MAAAPLTAVLTGDCRGDKYKLVQTIGKGTGGTVYQAVRLPRPEVTGDEGDHVAIKFIPLEPKYEEYLKMVKREVVIINQLNHPHIVRVQDLVKVPGNHAGASAPAIGLVMDLARISLQKYLSKHKLLAEGAVRWWFQQLMLAIDYCHTKKVVQRDIKPGNILIYPVPESKNTLILRLADFGWAKQFDISLPKSRAGTPLYAAPEVLRAGPGQGAGGQRPPYNPEAADVWSCGVVLYQLLFTQEFEVFADGVQDLQGVQDWESRIPPQTDRSPECLQLLRSMLQVAAERRATMADVLGHPWFTHSLPPGALQLNRSAGTGAPLIRQDRLERWLDDVIFHHTGVRLH